MSETLKDRLERIMNGRAAPRVPAEPAPRELPPAYQPFPLHALPPVLRDYVDAAARAIGCDPALVALPALATAAGAIGNSRALFLKRGWVEPAVVWAVAVGPSGTHKSPAFAAAVSPLQSLQMDAVQSRGEDKAPCYVTGDASVQAVGTILRDNPRGTLLARDELDGWFQSFTRFSGAGGSTDRPHWLELHRAGTLRVHRVTRGALSVRRACCSITGTIQPLVLARALDAEALAAGLGARFLAAAPPPRRRRWTEAEVAEELTSRYKALLADLLALPMDDDETHRPLFLRLAPDAKREWVAWYDRWAERQADAQAEQAALLSKLEGYAARLALVHAVVSMAAAGVPAARLPVGVLSLQCGIALAEWFAGEAVRLYSTLAETTQEREQRLLLDWLRDRGGAATPRELQRSRHGRYPTADDAEAALDGLRRHGWGEWVVTAPDAGGRPSRALRLVTNDKTPKEAEPKEVLSFVTAPVQGDGGAGAVVEDEIPE